MRCAVPPLSVASGGAAAVSASLNAQDFCASGVSFRAYPQPRVSSVHPSAGPLAGSTTLTVRGAHLQGLGERLLCRFRPVADASTRVGEASPWEAEAERRAHIDPNPSPNPNRTRTRTRT